MHLQAVDMTPVIFDEGSLTGNCSGEASLAITVPGRVAADEPGRTQNRFKFSTVADEPVILTPFR